MNVASALASAKASINPTIEILEKSVQAITPHAGTTPQMTYFVCRSLLRAGQLLDSSAVLAARHRFQDIWVLGRTVSELAINTCYLQVAPDIEFTRWTNYDLWTDERLIANLFLEDAAFEDVLDINELEEQRRQRKLLEASGLYKGARPGTWSELTLDGRAKIIDLQLKLKPDLFQLLYRLAVKMGDGFVHSSPRAVGTQTLPIVSKQEPSMADLHATAQALAMAATSVLGVIAFTRSRFGMSSHPLADRASDLLRAAYDNSGPE